MGIITNENILNGKGRKKLAIPVLIDTGLNHSGVLHWLGTNALEDAWSTATIIFYISFWVETFFETNTASKDSCNGYTS